MAAAAEFQKEVLEAIKDASPEIRDEIVNNLQKRRAIRSTLEFHCSGRGLWKVAGGQISQPMLSFEIRKICAITFGKV